jgi:hypothetical protein
MRCCRKAELLAKGKCNHANDCVKETLGKISGQRTETDARPIDETSLQKVTKSNREIKMELRGWRACYARGLFVIWIVERFALWLRQRIRQYLWKIWKTAKSWKHHLREAGGAELQIVRTSGGGLQA